MAIGNGSISKRRHLQDIVRCAILHREEMSNKDIAKKIGISAVAVTRNLQEARDKGILMLEIDPPCEAEIAEEIRSKYKLKEVLVYHIGVEEEVIEILAQIGAAYLEEFLDSPKEDVKRVAIGPGRTTLELVKVLSDNKRPEMEVESTSITSYKETFMASNILIGIASGKWECKLRRFIPEEMTDQEQENYGDVFIFGIERMLDMGNATAQALLYEFSYDESVQEKELHRLAGEGGACIINYQPIDGEGNPMEWGLEKYKETIEKTALPLMMIREIAKKKRVICIAGGEDNTKALRAALKGKYFNTLITDYETAEKLID